MKVVWFIRSQTQRCFNGRYLQRQIQRMRSVTSLFHDPLLTSLYMESSASWSLKGNNRPLIVLLMLGYRALLLGELQWLRFAGFSEKADHE